MGYSSRPFGIFFCSSGGSHFLRVAFSSTMAFPSPSTWTTIFPSPASFTVALWASSYVICASPAELMLHVPAEVSSDVFPTQISFSMNDSSMRSPSYCPFHVPIKAFSGRLPLHELNTTSIKTTAESPTIVLILTFLSLTGCFPLAITTTSFGLIHFPIIQKLSQERNSSLALLSILRVGPILHDLHVALEGLLVSALAVGGSMLVIVGRDFPVWVEAGLVVG